MKNEKIIVKKDEYLHPERMQDMTDGIFAFAMTLLIVSIEFPFGKGGATEEVVGQALLDMMPTFINFGIVFFLIGLIWYVHHKQFGYIKRTTSALFWINILTLLFVVFLPFSTDLMDNFNSYVSAVGVFNLNMLLISVMFLVQWKYCIRAKIIDDKVSPLELEVGTKKNIIFVSVTALTLVAGMISPSNSTYLYLLIPVFLFILDKKYYKRIKDEIVI